MNNKKYSNKQEKTIAKKLGGRVQPNSGATLFAKGDVKTKKFLIECKTATTKRKSMSIKEEWIDKQRSEAFAMGKPYWSVAFNFGGLNNNENFYIIDEQLFKHILEMIEE